MPKRRRNMRRRRNMSDIDERMLAVLEQEDPEWVKVAEMYGVTHAQLISEAQNRVKHLGGFEFEYDFDYRQAIYMVVDSDEAYELADEQIRNTLWAFRATFLEWYLDIPAVAIQAIQEQMYEDANDVFMKIAESRGKLQRLLSDAVTSDGLEHWLNNGEDVDEVNGYYLWEI